MSSEIIGTRVGNAPVPLSILDFAMAGQGLTTRDALTAKVELARLVNRRGSNRYKTGSIGIEVQPHQQIAPFNSGDYYGGANRPN